MYSRAGTKQDLSIAINVGIWTPRTTQANCGRSVGYIHDSHLCPRQLGRWSSSILLLRYASAFSIVISCVSVCLLCYILVPLDPRRDGTIYGRLTKRSRVRYKKHWGEGMNLLIIFFHVRLSNKGNYSFFFSKQRVQRQKKKKKKRRTLLAYKTT